MVSLRDALRMKGIQIRDHASSKDEIRICCPFCSDAKFRLGINTSTGQAHCFNCDYKSRNVVKALMKQLTLTPVTTDTQKTEKKTLEEIEMPEGAFLLGKKWKSSRWSREAFAYLLDRGFTREDMIEKHVMFTEIGKYSHRVLFPVIVEKKVVGLVGRGILKSQTPKYLNTRGIKAIWNMPDKPKENVILCEGVIKAMTLEKVFGDTFSVGALLGGSITDVQISQLKKVKRVLLWPDPDPPGLRGAIKIAYKLRSKYAVALPKVIPNRQADEMEADEILLTFKSMERLSDSIRCRYTFHALKREREA